MPPAVPLHLEGSARRLLAGLGIEILTLQVEKIMNVTVDTDGWITDVAEIVKSIPDASVASVLVGVSTIVLLRLTKRFTPKLPGPLIPREGWVRCCSGALSPAGRLLGNTAQSVSRTVRAATRSGLSRPSVKDP
jgi:hypothetical protein